MGLIPKIVSCCTLFIVTFFFGVLPCGIVRILNRRVPKSSSKQKYVSWMNCFAGGVFFGTTFLHLLPESLEELRKGLHLPFPIAEVFISSGFFFVLFLEHLFGYCFICCRSDADKNKLLNTMYIRENEYEIGELKGTTLSQPEKNKEQIPINGELGNINRSYASNCHVEETTISEPSADEAFRKSPSLPEQTPEIETVDDGRLSSFAGRSLGDHEYEDIEGIENESEEGKISAFRATVLVIALSLHMVFEGLALGLQDTVPAVWTLLIVISVHKCIVATSVGLKLNDVMKNFRQIAFCLFMFSLVTPLGIVIGILINSLTSTENIVSGMLECIATGSFLYVTFFEILQREFNEHHNMLKVFLTIFGFGVSAGAKLLQTYYHKE